MTKQIKNYVSDLPATPVDGHCCWVQFGEGSIGTIYENKYTKACVVVKLGPLNSIRYVSYRNRQQKGLVFSELDDAIRNADFNWK